MILAAIFQRSLLLLSLLTFNSVVTAKKSSKSSSWCTCSPMVYQWTLNLEGICEVPENDAIGMDSTCTVTEGTPVQVTKLKFFEYDQEFGLANYQSIDGIWISGDTMSIESITKSNPHIVTNAASFELDALDANGNEIMFQWIVDYTNACGIEPYTNVTNIGWMEWDIVDGPDPDLCDPCAGDMSSASGKGKGATMKCSKKKIKVQKSSKSSKNLSRRRMRMD